MIKKAFTLIELIITIAVISILSAVSVATYFGITISANNTRCETELREYYKTLRLSTTDGYYLQDQYIKFSNNKLELSTPSRDLIYLASKNNYDYSETLLFDVLNINDINKDNFVLDKNEIFFFYTSYNDIYEICYIGYIPSSLDETYMKFLNITTNEITSEIGDFGNTEANYYVSNFNLSDNYLEIDNNYFYFYNDKKSISYVKASHSPFSHEKEFVSSLSNLNTKGKIKSISIEFNEDIKTALSLIMLNEKQTYSDLYYFKDKYENIIDFNISSNEFSYNFKFYDNYSYFIILFKDNIEKYISNINVKYNLFYSDITYSNKIDTSIICIDSSQYSVSNTNDSIYYGSLKSNVLFGFDNTTKDELYIKNISIKYEDLNTDANYKEVNFTYKLYKGIIFTVWFDITPNENTEDGIYLYGNLEIEATLNNNFVLKYQIQISPGL